MNFLLRLLKAIAGAPLFLLMVRRVNLEQLLGGHRVAIVGAADSANNTGKGGYIDGFDVVIRINKAPLIIEGAKSVQDIGRKVDLLFHSFFESGDFGGGPLRFDLYDGLGIKYVVNPLATFEGYRATFNFYKKYLLMRTVYMLRRSDYARITDGLQGYRPTTGFSVLRSVLNTNFSELYITGFTFFKTPYGDGYRTSLQDVQKLRTAMTTMKIHNPDLEFEQFLRTLESCSTKNIVMDPVLTKIVESHARS